MPVIVVAQDEWLPKPEVAQDRFHCTYFSERDEIGQRMFVELANVSLAEGYLCLWDKMTKKKLKTFSTSDATIEMNAGGNLVKIKEER